MNHPTATTRVLQVPELFAMVVGEADNGTMATMARVRKGWSEVALSHLWSVQTDLEPLFRLLAPYGFELRDNKLGLRGYPTEYQWHRFYEHSKRVKALIIDDRAERHSPILDTFARLRPIHIGQNGNLFPALRTLHWSAATESSLLYRSILFMHPGIRTFHLDLPQSYAHTAPGPILGEYIEHVIGRMPRIQHLSIQMRGYWSVVEPYVLLLVKGYQKTLVSLEIPVYWTSNSLLEALSAFPNFQELTKSEKMDGVYDPARRFSPSIPTSMSSWPSLEVLHLSVPYGEVTQFLQKNYLPPSLRELGVFTPRLETSSAIRDLCVEIAKRCPTVSIITLNKCWRRPLDQPLLPALEDCPSIDDISPVLSNPSLLHFSFRHELPLSFPLAKLPEVLSKIPEIELLDLNPNPDYDPASYSKGDFLSIDSLSLIQKYCPRLQELAIYVDGKNSDFTTVVPSYIEAADYFEDLFSLALGGPGPNPFAMSDVLTFLSRILALDCEVTSATESRPRGILDVVADGRQTFWRNVNERLPLLIKVRLDEVERIANYYEAILDRAERELERCGGDTSMLEHPDETDQEGDGVDPEFDPRSPPPAYELLPRSPGRA